MPVNWQERISLSYFLALHFFNDIGRSEEVREFLSEALSFCKVFAVTEIYVQQIEKFVSYQSEDRAGQGFKRMRTAQKSRSYSIDQRAVEIVRRVLKANESDEALVELTQYLSANPANPGAWYVLGKSMLRRHDDLSAMMYFENARIFAPDVSDAYLEIAKIYHKLDKLEQEIDTLLKAFALNNHDFDVCLRLARAYKGLEQNKEAIHYYQLAWQIGSDEQDEVLQELAELLQIENEPAQALEYYWESLYLNPFKSDIIIKALAVIEQLADAAQLQYLGRRLAYDQIAAALLRYLWHDASTPTKAFELISPHFVIGEYEVAWAILSRLLNYFPSHKPLDLVIYTLTKGGHELEAMFYSALKDLEVDQYEEASEKLLTYLGTFPEDDEARLYLAWCYAAVTKVQSELHLIGLGALFHSNLALKECLTTFFRGINKCPAYELLGEIFFLKGKTNAFFYNYAILAWEEVYFAQPTPQLITKIGQAKFERFMEVLSNLKPIDVPEILKRIKDEILNWLADSSCW